MMKFLRTFSPYETHDHLWPALLVIALLGGLGVLMLLGVKG
jgi:hypothetical protein